MAKNPPGPNHPSSNKVCLEANLILLNALTDQFSLTRQLSLKYQQKNPEQLFWRYSDVFLLVHLIFIKISNQTVIENLKIDFNQRKLFVTQICYFEAGCSIIIIYKYWCERIVHVFRYRVNLTVRNYQGFIIY